MPPQADGTGLFIQVGCEPGSEFCGGCGERRLGPFDLLSNVFSATCAKFGGCGLRVCNREHLRCPACLEAEAAHKALLDRADARRTVGPATEKALQALDDETAHLCSDDDMVADSTPRGKRLALWAIRAALAADAQAATTAPERVRISPDDLVEYEEERNAREMAQGAIRESQRQQAISLRGRTAADAQAAPEQIAAIEEDAGAATTVYDVGNVRPLHCGKLRGDVPELH